MGYHSHAWEPRKKKRAKKFRGVSSIERAGQDNALGVSDRAYIGHLSRSDSLVMVYTIVLIGRVSTTGVCSPHLTKQKFVILMM